MITAHGIVTLMASLVDDLSAGTCRAMDRHVVSLVYGHMSYTCGVSCLVVRPFVVALSTVWSFVCASAASCAYSCSAHVRPCAQGRCDRCPPGSGVMSDFFFFFFFVPSLL